NEEMYTCLQLTSEQRNKCDMFMRNKFRVLLCSNHVKIPVADTYSPSTGNVRSIAGDIHPSLSAIEAQAQSSNQQLSMDEEARAKVPGPNVHVRSRSHVAFVESHSALTAHEMVTSEECTR
ncbi:hypothetical protein PMAYCL1PPCAC_22454, partial [Pristionchus mayeri]